MRAAGVLEMGKELETREVQRERALRIEGRVAPLVEDGVGMGAGGEAEVGGVFLEEEEREREVAVGWGGVEEGRTGVEGLDFEVEEEPK